MKSKSVFWCITTIVVIVGAIEGVYGRVFIEIFPAVLFFLAVYAAFRVAIITEEEARKDKYLKLVLTFMIISVLYCLTKDFYYFSSRLSPLTDFVRMIVILNFILLFPTTLLIFFYYKYYRPRPILKKWFNWCMI